MFEVARFKHDDISTLIIVKLVVVVVVIVVVVVSVTISNVGKLNALINHCSYPFYRRFDIICQTMQSDIMYVYNIHISLYG